MAIVRIEQIYLYTDQVFNSERVDPAPGSGDPVTASPPVVAESDSAKAIAWFAEQGITDYVNLNYGDPASHADCFAPLNSWEFIGKKQDIASFPFVYYTEVHDDRPVNAMPMVLLYGLDEIKNSNLSALYQLGK